MGNSYCPRWQYNNEIVIYLMKIHAAVKTVNLLNLPMDLEEQLKKESILKTVHYSTKIEGNSLNLNQVRDVLEKDRGKWPDKKDVHEVKQYYDALVFLEQNALTDTIISEDFVKQLHEIIFAKHQGKKKQKSTYREGQNVIRESGTGAIAYLPPEAKDVPDLMKKLVTWIENDENRDIPVPIVAAIAAYQLLTIHPFWDGNGRTARALATYILKRGNYDLKGFYSMEEFYDKDIQRYYGSLQRELHHNYYFGRNNPDLTPWISYFLEVMADIFARVDQKVNALYHETSNENDFIQVLDKRERWVASVIMQKGFIRSDDICEHFNVDNKTAMNWFKNWETKGFLKRKDMAQKRYIEFILKKK
jgi:cell filamentation protein, protein adenylyltransferase